jgi:hypothetical protein
MGLVNAEPPRPEHPMLTIPTVTLTGRDADFGLPGDVMTVVLTKIPSTTFTDAVAANLDLPTGQCWDQTAGQWVAEGGTQLPTSRLKVAGGYSIWWARYSPAGVLPGEIVLPIFYHSRLGCLGVMDPGVALIPRVACVTLAH